MTDEIWPRCGQRVELHLDGVDLVAVVDDVRPPEQLHLREPVSLAGAPVPEPGEGTPLLLAWTTALGLHRLRTTLAERVHARIPLWRLRPESVPSIQQRREYIRVPDTLRVELVQGEQHWAARLCDLSEGGTRCVLLDPATPAVGDRLRMELELEHGRLEVPAVVLAVGPRDEEGRTTMRVRFDGGRRDADALRRRVLELQRRARAAGLR